RDRSHVQQARQSRSVDDRSCAARRRQLRALRRRRRAIGRETDGSLGDEIATALAHNYGAAYRRVLALASERADLSRPIVGSTTLRAEVVNAVRDEMATRLSDVVFRRTDLATGGHPGEAALAEAADLMAQELRWDERRRSE